MTSGTRMPTYRERENNKRRERKRRAVAAKIFTGLRMYGNYELPKHCDNNEVLKALCNEAGWVVELDGTTYRKGCSRPVERMEIGVGSATASPCSSYQPSRCASYNPSPGSSNFMSPNSSSFANLTSGDGQSLIPWLKHLSTTSSSSASSSSRLPNYLYIPGGSISAPVTPPLSSPTARTPTDWQQLNNSFFVSSTPPSPTRQIIPDSEWFSGIQLAQSVPASPTFSLVSQKNPFGFKEEAAASAGGGGSGSRMWTPGQSGTCSPAIQTGDVPMSEAVVAPPPEFAFGSNTNGLVKAWEGERIHEESGSDDLELTLGNSSTRFTDLQALAIMSREDLSDTLRILVATDCHLGYMEKDEIRRHDSFKAFDEICSIAEEKQVDFLLLGGDLFHENKPSRTTLVKAIEILRRHCLNDKPVQFQVVSDQTVNFQNTFGHVNYEDPHFNVGLPVFSIHGNHDDPAGVDNLSAIDILSACNLVNYFGKMVLGGSGVGQISLYPILMRKGSTTVALYGLGNIRDERLNRMFQTPHAVQWMRPEVQEGCDVSDWFNILVLHQNRVKSNPKNAISEHFLPRFLDFIVWGHEHECLIDPQEVSGMGFHITQPGSSVATSLIDGESKPKHVLLLEIKGNQYRPTKIPLTSVRPFEYTEIVLKDEGDIDPNDQNSILEHLDKVVRELIEKASKKAVNRSDIKLPLVRIKVDYSGFMTINPQRFGQKYVGKVANPQDILIFSKASKKGRSEANIDDSERLRPEELNQQNIEALVAESNLKMEILPVNDLDVALHNFVNKDDKLAFYSCVQYNLQETRGKLGKDSDAQKFEEDDLILKVGECLEERLKDRSTRPSGSSQFLSTGLTSENLTKRSSGIANASFSDDEDTTQIPATRGRRGSSTGTTTRGRAKAPTRGRGRGKAASTAMKQTTLDSSLGFRQSQRSASASFKSASTIEEADVDSPSSDEAEPEDVDRSSEEDENTKGKGRKRQATTRRGRGSGALKRGRKNESSSSLHKLLSSKDDEEDEDDEDIEKKLNRSQPRVTRNYGALRR